MELVKDAEALIHLIAQAFAKAKGDLDPTIFADVVLEHARALVGKASAPAEVTAPVVVEAPAVETPVVAEPAPVVEAPAA